MHHELVQRLMLGAVPAYVAAENLLANAADAAYPLGKEEWNLWGMHLAQAPKYAPDGGRGMWADIKLFDSDLHRPLEDHHSNRLSLEAARSRRRTPGVNSGSHHFGDHYSYAAARALRRLRRRRRRCPTKLRICQNTFRRQGGSVKPRAWSDAWAPQSR